MSKCAEKHPIQIIGQRRHNELNNGRERSIKYVLNSVIFSIFRTRFFMKRGKGK